MDKNTIKTVKVKNIEFGAGKPKICVPLTGKTEEALRIEAQAAALSGADLAEWRIDWYDDVFKIEKMEQTGRMISNILNTMPLLITFRTKEEGGEKPIELSVYEKLLTYICDRKLSDMIDIEAFRDEETVKRLIHIAHQNEIVTVGSNHEFFHTPAKEEIIARLCKMQELGFDITKIAVMPETERDVLTLLDATLVMKENNADRPFITMSMSVMGAVSRIAGECFGSCLTFGTIGAASAPGQMDAAELGKILELLHVK